MADPSYTRTQITLYVLTEEPLPEDIGLGTIIEWCDTGPAVLDELHRVSDTLTGRQMAEALNHAGSDPGFFSLDDAGNRTEG